VAGIVLQALEEMNPQLPSVDVDIEEIGRLYEQAKRELAENRK
jgi:hypothetical protein